MSPSIVIPTAVMRCLRRPGTRHHKGTARLLHSLGYNGIALIAVFPLLLGLGMIFFYV